MLDGTDPPIIYMHRPMYTYGHESDETRRGSVSVLEHGEKLFGP